ncbi:hypothetical protein HDU92_007488, partial [Lobulomyces angularis]
ADSAGPSTQPPLRKKSESTAHLSELKEKHPYFTITTGMNRVDLGARLPVAACAVNYATNPKNPKTPADPPEPPDPPNVADS